MPQMSPLMWEFLNLMVIIMLALTLVKIFFFLEQKNNVSEGQQKSSKMGTIYYLNWTW